MDPTYTSPEETNQQFPNAIRSKPLPELEELAEELLSATNVPHAYIRTLNDQHKSTALKACLLVFISSKRRIVPRRFQLEATLALEDGRDVLIDSGTGSGKTLCQIIPNLLHPASTSMTISPLKRLQILQVPEFEAWGIRTMSINEDTPNDKALWEKIKTGDFQHLIVQPEQLKSFHGHTPRLARLLHVSQFVKTISRVHFDEIHFHHTAGLPHYGLPAFRPAWGSLNELALRLPKGPPIQALSGTLPPHINAAVIDHLNFDPAVFLSLKLSSNRPNIIYCTHRIVGSLSDFRNLDFLVSIPFTRLLKVVIYHDDTQQSSDAASYTDNRLPPHLRKTGIVRHYHSGMSAEYLKQVFDDFSNPNGGLHVDDIDAVVDYGVPQHKSTAQQRAGRCGRRGQLAVYLAMAEPWAYTMSLDAVDPDNEDPDQPISGRLLKNAKKRERAGLAMIRYVRSTICLREMIRRYLADDSDNALAISTEWCCDLNHPGEPGKRFDKSTFFPGRFIYADESGAIYAGDIDDPDRVHLNPKTKKRKPKGPPNRKVIERQELQTRLYAWLDSAHASDPLRAVRPASHILDGTAIKRLSVAHPSRITSTSNVIYIIQESDEWAVEWSRQIFDIISGYDSELARNSRSTSTTNPARKAKEKPVEDEDEYRESQTKKPKPNGPLVEVSLNVRRSRRLADK
ncbi:P-loop containing nucleoside triphosphate hydrolase protein [Mycena sanguinolenta]|nr:P-loop containing nucleoside triphosphate hydrolase protein [Mycena sanguinolenta]